MSRRISGSAGRSIHSTTSGRRAGHGCSSRAARRCRRPMASSSASPRTSTLPCFATISTGCLGRGAGGTRRATGVAPGSTPFAMPADAISQARCDDCPHRATCRHHDGAGRVEVDASDAMVRPCCSGIQRSSHVMAPMSTGGTPRVGGEISARSHRPVSITPYVAEKSAGISISPSPTSPRSRRREAFWDKVVIAHGLRRWYERRGELRHEGQRVSRHYYDLHCLLGSETGKPRSPIPILASIVRHARMFFVVPTMISPRRSRHLRHRTGRRDGGARSRATIPTRPP